MGLFTRWFDRMVANSWERASTDCEEPQAYNSTTKRSRGIGLASVQTRGSFESDNGLNMQVYKAIGGKIISFNNYDNKTDRHQRSVYIITDEQDFERELGKCITMESMKL